MGMDAALPCFGAASLPGARGQVRMRSDPEREGWCFHVWRRGPTPEGEAGEWMHVGYNKAFWNLHRSKWIAIKGSAEGYSGPFDRAELAEPREGAVRGDAAGAGILDATEGEERAPELGEAESGGVRDAGETAMAGAAAPSTPTGLAVEPRASADAEATPLVDAGAAPLVDADAEAPVDAPSAVEAETGAVPASQTPYLG